MKASSSLEKLLSAQPLPLRVLEGLFKTLFRGQIKPEVAKALLLLLAKKGEQTPEIWGCLRALRHFESPREAQLPYLMDLCGTGGGGAATFNISTVSAFVVAGAGGYVAKHGNRAVSSRVGSSDLMEALGVRINVPYPTMLQALRDCRFGYFHAPLYHPSFKKIQPLRQELGVRTLFNLLGPLVNPIRLRFQMIGVSNPEWARPIAQTLLRLGRDRAAVFTSEDGLDELSTAKTNAIFYLEGGKINPMRLDPRKFGFSKVRTRDYAGGDLQTNRDIALGILENRIRGPRLDVVLLNSGFALWLVGLAASVSEGIERARWSLRSSRAERVLELLRLQTKKESVS